MNVACLGYGVVGQGVVELLKKDDRFKVIWILVKDLKECDLPEATTDVQQILKDNEVDMVIEMMGGIEFPYFCISESLKRGKHVVTSNKAVLQAHYRELIELAEKNHVSLGMEASVCGGIPWITTLLNQNQTGEIDRVEGIFNGTTNYILDRMHAEHQDFDEILKDAQRLGYAESDPSDDIDGKDSLRKLMISSSIAFKTVTDMDSFASESLRKIKKYDIEAFERKGLRCRYIASAQKEGDCYTGSVEPTLFKSTDVQATIKLNNNLALLNHSALGTLQLIGQGAGRYPTANAVVQDVVQIYGHRDMIPQMNQVLSAQPSMQNCRLYVRASNDAMDEILPWIEEKEGLSGWTKSITQLEKKELIDRMMNLDSDFFYAIIK